MNRYLFLLILVIFCSTALFADIEEDLKLPEKFSGQDLALPIELDNIRYLDSLINS